MRTIRIATRASRLAIVQTDIVADSIRELCPDVKISVVKVTTKGDSDKSDFLYKSSSVGYFTSAVEQTLLQGRADLAVHSLKDLPTAETHGLLVAAIPKRLFTADALVTSSGASSIETLPKGATVGTSSLRRIAQLKHLRNDLKCVPLRGNIETRISKVRSGKVDAAVIACAGLIRLGLSDKISAVLAPSVFLPAPGQGALAVQIRPDDTDLLELISQLDDEPTRIATQAERKILEAMHGGCSIPFGAYARIDGRQILIDAMIADIDGGNVVRRSAASPVEEHVRCAELLAEQLLQAGGGEILKKLRKT